MAYPVNVISFVVDDGPIYQTQAWLLLHNLSKLIDPRHTKIMLNHCGRLSREVHSKAEDVGAYIFEIPRYGTGSAAYCNKLQQFENVIACGAEYVVMCDTDIAFLIDPSTLASETLVRAKQVDCNNPTTSVFQTLLDLANLTHVQLDYRPEFQPASQHGSTHKYNCNGGLYVLGIDTLRHLAPIWHKWAEFCLFHASIMGRGAIHSDQVSFALAMEELQQPFEPLGIEFNFPLHFPADAYVNHSDIAPRVLHYHRNMRSDGSIAAPKVPNIMTETDRFNALVKDGRASPAFQALLALSHTEPTE